MVADVSVHEGDEADTHENLCKNTAAIIYTGQSLCGHLAAKTI